MLAEVLYIGDRLRTLRKRRLLTQEQLAERSGIAVSTVIRIERNQVEPHGATIRKLADALGTTAAELVED
jgi:transcriptional regulator with XRE-family HTH domain